jgi:hypothetical protein
MNDDIRSWNSSHAIEASKVNSESMYLVRRLLRVTFLPAVKEDMNQVMAAGVGDADPGFTW